MYNLKIRIQDMVYLPETPATSPALSLAFESRKMELVPHLGFLEDIV